jgi:hypothetical protein
MSNQSRQRAKTVKVGAWSGRPIAASLDLSQSAARMPGSHAPGESGRP